MLVESGAIVNIENFYIAGSGLLENHGFIAGNFFVDDWVELRVQNFGNITGGFSLGAHSHLYQIVTGPDDLHPLKISDRGTGASFTILADGAKGISFAGLAEIAHDADKLILKNSVIEFAFGDILDVPIEIDGTVVLKIVGAPKFDGQTLFHVIGYNGILFVQSPNPKMFYVDAKEYGDELILSLRRETDYAKIIGGAKGRFINSVRASGSSHDIIARMDAAQSESELYRAMGDSVMFNPAKLLDPLKVMARFDAFGITMGNPDSIAGAGNIAAIFGNGLSLYAGNAGLEFTAGDFAIGAYGLAGQFAKDGVEDFSGMMYGGILRAALRAEYLYADLSGGVVFADFATGPIYDGTADGTRDPRGVAYYGAAELGVRVFNTDGGLYAMPIVRARAFAGKVLDESESEFAIGGGARAGYRVKMQSLDTEYSAYGLMESMGPQVGVRMDVNMPRDGVAVSLDAAALQADAGWFYKIGAGAKVVF